MSNHLDSTIEYLLQVSEGLVTDDEILDGSMQAPTDIKQRCDPVRTKKILHVAWERASKQVS